MRVLVKNTHVGNIEPAYQQATAADLIRSLHISSNCSPSSPLEQVGSPRPGKPEKHASDNRVPSCLDVDCSVSGSTHKTARGLTPYLRRQRQQQKRAEPKLARIYGELFEASRRSWRTRARVSPWMFLPVHWKGSCTLRSSRKIPLCIPHMG